MSIRFYFYILFLLALAVVACTDEQVLPQGVQGASPELQAPVLPKWETEKEKRLGRKSRKSTSVGGYNLDVFEDYRKSHSGNFFVTEPTMNSVRTPAEYEPSQAYLVGWDGSYWDEFFFKVMEASWNVVPVIIPYIDSSHKSKLATALQTFGLDPDDSSNVIWWQKRLNSVWARDYGPISIINMQGEAKLSFVDFSYYHIRVNDDEVPTKLAQDWDVNVFRPGLVLEGGNFMSTTDGLCVLTKRVLAANTNFGQGAVEEIFENYLGCTKFLFPQELKGEPTGHIDMFAKFASDMTVIVGEYSLAQDSENKAILDANAALFAGATNGAGQPLVVTRIPMPNNKDGGKKIWRTYTNSMCLSNGTDRLILVPVYSDETTYEKAALAVYGTAFPGWTQVKVDGAVVIGSGGAVHCVAMQIPAGIKSKMEADPGDLCGMKSFECDEGVPCDGIDGTGCCDGETLVYCNSRGKLTAVDCEGAGKCGWDVTEDWYACGTSGEQDPKGTPRACNIVTDSGASDFGVGDSGTTPDQGISPPECAQVSYEGCCDGDILYFCQGDKLRSLDCGSNPSCGWNMVEGYYDCRTSGTADPLKIHPLLCVGLLPDSGIDLGGSDGIADMLDLGMITDSRGLGDEQVVKSDSGPKDAVWSEDESNGAGCACTLGDFLPPSGIELMLIAFVFLMRRRHQTSKRFLGI
ncbi:MAG: agmatine deiminase family protein [Pseudomonadota bacterium]